MDTSASRDARDLERPLAGLRADDVMSSDVATVTTTTTLGEAMTVLRTLGVRHLPVLDDGRFAGMVDDRLVAFALLAASGFGEALERPVSTVMTHYVPQVAPEEALTHVAHLLSASPCGAVVVLGAQGHLRGIVTRVDVVSAVALSADRPA